MDGLFDSAWLKWGGAVIHSHALQADIDAWAVDPNRETGFEITKRYDAKRHCVVLSVASIDPLPIRWGLRLGGSTGSPAFRNASR